MSAPLPLRSDYDAGALRGLARQSKDAKQTRRLLALAVIYDGGSRADAARLGGVTLQIVRDWVLRFNTGGPDGLLDRKAPGPTPRLTPEQRRVLAALVESGPIPAVHGVVRWRLVDLVQWVFEEFRISLSPQTMSRELRTMGYRRLSARPRHHAAGSRGDPGVQKTSPPFWRRSGRGSAPAPHWNSGGKTRRA